MELKHKDISDLECPLCQSLLYEPISTSCGHTFCRSCILRSQDHTNKCPICRAVIHITAEQPVNVLIQTILLKNFPEEYKARKMEVQEQIQSHADNMPLFIIELVLFPTMSLPLHVFEPRYRLMLRRCLEGGRRFGVVPVINNELAKVEFVNCNNIQKKLRYNNRSFRSF